MLLQNTLDLSTFEIVRFRIWNQTSHPDDKGVGTKYFNTNSGHEGYNRENIYTATGWRMSAYMDDIDRINEKLDLIFGEELDTDGIISSWKEVQDFLDQIPDTKDLMDLLNSKLSTSGGTMNGLLYIQDVDKPRIIFKDNTENLGVIGFMNKKPSVYTFTDNAWYTILHSGNIGEYNAGGVIYRTKIENQAELDAFVEGGIVKFARFSNISNVGFRYNDGMVMSIPWSSATEGVQLAFDEYSANPTMAVRAMSNSIWGDWKTLAFTDSTVANAEKVAGLQVTLGNNNPWGTIPAITEGGYMDVGKHFEFHYDNTTYIDYSTMLRCTGNHRNIVSLPSKSGTLALLTDNVDSATKLQTERTIWGRPFDGTGNVTGDLILGYNTIRGANDENALELSADTLSLAYSYRAKTTAIYGGTVRFERAGAVSMLINSSGNILIGTTEDNGAKLQVAGEMYSIKQTLGNTLSVNRNVDTGSIINTSLSAWKVECYADFVGLSVYSGDGTAKQNFLKISPATRDLQVVGNILIPTGQSLTLGSVTFRETAAGEVEVDGNLHTTGTLASGGKAQEGTGNTGNAQVYQYTLASGQSSYSVQNVKNNTNVIVQVYEWNNTTESWDMILTDVNVKASGITVTFGRATTVNHLVTVC